MDIAGQNIKEIISIETLTLRPGEKSEIIKRQGTEHLIVIATQGVGVMKPIAEPESFGYLLNYARVGRFDFRKGDEFYIEIGAEQDENFKAILIKVLPTKHC